jgi:DNA polymerase-3 subunit beta
MMTLNRHELTAALKRAAKLLPKSTHVLPLRNVRLSTDEDSLMLSSTNLEQSLVEIFPAVNDTEVHPASACVPITPLLGVVQALPTYLREVPIEVRPDHIIVGTTKLSVGCPTDDYPAIPKIPKNAPTIIDVPDDFPRHLRFVRSAASQDLTRHVLQGILLDFRNGNMVGCDGKRLHCAHLWNPSKAASVVVPPTVFEIDVPTHIIVPEQQEKEVRQAFFLTQTGYIATITIDGTYPNYLDLVRKEHTLIAHVERLELLNAVEQAIPMLNERSPVCTLHLNDQFEIRATNTEAGSEYVNEVPAAIDGEEITATVNAHYLRDLLRHTTAEHLTMAFRKPGESIYIVSGKGDQWALLMPLTINAPTPTKA